jgi:hypothetical protein
MADTCARCLGFSSTLTVDTLALASNEERAMYFRSSRCRRSWDGSPNCQLKGWRVQGRGVNDLKSTTFRDGAAVEGQLFAQRPIRRPLGAQALHEIDRPNLTLRRTRLETTRSAPRLGALWRLDGAALRRLERRRSAEAPTPSQWERLNPKDKKCHLVRMTEVAAAKQIAVANPTP